MHRVQSTNDRAAKTVRRRILDGFEGWNALPLILKNFPCAVDAPVVDDDNLVRNAVNAQFVVKASNRRRDAALFIASRYDNGETPQRGWCVIHVGRSGARGGLPDSHGSNVICRPVYLRLDSPALRGAHPVDKQDAVEMIVLVLNRPSKEAACFKLYDLLIE